MNWQQIEPLLVALAVGLLIGMERERSHARELPAGSRTFALLALVGAVAESLDPPLALGGLVIVGALMIVAYFRTSDEDPGTTTVIAAVAAYLLGALAYSRPAVAVAVAVIVTTLLWSKTRIHRFVRQILTEVEVEDAIKFFVVAFVVLPLLPDRDLGPYGQLNPEKLWLLVVLLTGIAGFTRVLSIEGRKYNIRVWSMSPGALTRMTEDLQARRGDSYKPAGPEMVAPAMLYMCSDLSGDQTNKILTISSARGVREMKIFMSEGWMPKGPWTAQDLVKHADKVFFKDDAKAG